MWRGLLISFVSVVAVQHVLTFVYIMGYHKHVYKHRPGDCQLIKGPDYVTEDMELLSNGLVLIAAVHVLKTGLQQGRIYALDISAPQNSQTRVAIEGRSKVPLHPVGLSSITDTNTGKITIYLVNKGRKTDSIEVYEFQLNQEKPTLIFLEHKQDPLMRSVSDVLAVGRNEFYFTNEAFNKDPVIRLFEHYMMFRWGGVVFCDGTMCRRSSFPLYEPSGLHMSADGKTLVTSQLCGMGVHIYSRNPADNVLSNQTRLLGLGSMVDNAFVDSAGNIWTANHPVAYKFAAQQRDRMRRAPSQVLLIKFDKSSPSPRSSYEVFEVYSDDGSQLSASSSVIVHHNTLLIASKRSGILQCEVCPHLY